MMMYFGRFGAFPSTRQPNIRMVKLLNKRRKGLMMGVLKIVSFNGWSSRYKTLNLCLRLAL